MDEPREIELEINLLLFNKKITLKGSPETLDCEPLNFVWDDEWEGDNQNDPPLPHPTHNELFKNFQEFQESKSESISRFTR